VTRDVASSMGAVARAYDDPRNTLEVARGGRQPWRDAAPEPGACSGRILVSTTSGSVAEISVFGRSCHPACIACGDSDRGGLDLRFRQEADGSVVAPFACESLYQGYPDQLHGGVIALLLDAAMMHCLFARGICGVTTNLEIQFRHPVRVGLQAHVRARLREESPSYYVLCAKIMQGDTACAVAEGVFAPKAPIRETGGESR